MRSEDGQGGDTDYGKVGAVYSNYRQPEPHIASLIDEALGDARTVLNVGAGAGSYEPVDRDVTALEPSASMRLQRPAHLPAAIAGIAESLPFADGAFDASMTTFSVHQWSGLERGLKEMRRVSRGPVIVLSCDPDLVQAFWLHQFVPEVLRAERVRYPRIETICRILGGEVSVADVPIPLLCRDGFNEAYYGRPEMFLDAGARLACSAWSFVPEPVIERGIADLGKALISGAWDQAYGDLRRAPYYSGSLRLIVSRPPSGSPRNSQTAV